MEEGISDVPPPPDQLQHLFPVQGDIQSGWTTATFAAKDEYNIPPNITPMIISDAPLGVCRISSGTTHKVYTLSDGTSKAWEAVYPKGSCNPSGEIRGGLGFYLKGPEGEWRSRLQNSTAVVFAYAVRFQDDFDFVKGGKLPGIFGGDGGKAFSCTGGRKDDRCNCFNLRLMWRAHGQGELYAYLPINDSNTHRLLSIPGSHQNPDYGFSVGRGSFVFRPGIWSIVAEMVKLNDPGQENGEIEVWIDGNPVIKVTGLVLRTTKQSVIQGLHFQTFFGGSTPDWASSKEERAWFASISGAILAAA